MPLYSWRYGESWFSVAEKLFGDQHAAYAFEKEVRRLNPSIERFLPGMVIEIPASIDGYKLKNKWNFLDNPIVLAEKLFEVINKVWKWWRGEMG